MSKRFCKFEMEYGCTCKEQLVSVHVLDETHDQLQRAETHYREEKSRMQQEITELHALLKGLGSKHATKVDESC